MLRVVAIFRVLAVALDAAAAGQQQQRVLPATRRRA